MRVSWGPSVVNWGHPECTQMYSLIHILKAPRSPLFLNWCHRRLLPCVLTHCVSFDQLKSVQRMNVGLSLFMKRVSSPSHVQLKRNNSPARKEELVPIYYQASSFGPQHLKQKSHRSPSCLGKAKHNGTDSKERCHLTPSFCLYEGRDLLEGEGVSSLPQT